MNGKQELLMPVFTALFTAMIIGCGGSSAPPPQEAEEEDTDIIGSIVGDVEIEDTDDDGELDDDTYTGPTSVTINLKVVNDRNPKGSFRLLTADGTVIIEKGALGEPVDLNQGVYNIEFKSPLVFGEPTYLVEDVEIAGKKLELNNVFPAGQITLHTFRGKNQKKCVPISFSVNSKTIDKALPGKGKTCERLILETGTYEVLLSISKKKVQPVAMQINAEQVSTAPVKLER